MGQDIFKHDHVISSWITLCVSRDGVTTTVLMIETDLNPFTSDWCASCHANTAYEFFPV